MSESKQPFRWPRRASSSGIVHLVIGPSRFGGREQMFCDMNFLNGNYDRTVSPVTCAWCLEVLRHARAGRHKDAAPLLKADGRIMAAVAEREALHGVDETVSTEVSNANVGV